MQIKVGDQYRKNYLSLDPGGSIVKVKMVNGKILVYDKVKNVDAYAKKAMTDPTVIEIYVNDVLFWKKQQG